MALSGLSLAGAAPGSASARPVTRLGSIPNIIWDEHTRLLAGQDPGTVAGAAHSTAIFTDPANGLLFESSGGASPNAHLCPNTPFPIGESQPLVVMDVDTFAVRAVGCGGPRPGGITGSFTDSPLVAVDSADRLLFFTDAASDSSSSRNASDSIIALDEMTLRPVAKWVAPPTSPATGQTIFGLTWYQPTNELIVLRAGSQSSPFGPASIPTVSVQGYDVRASLTAGSSATPAWSTVVSQCAFALQNKFGTSSAVRSRRLPFLYVPCGLTGSTSPATPRTGVVRMSLDRTGAPDGQVAVAAAPGSSGDALFDAGSDRMFLPTQDNTGTSLLTYDGRSAQFIGRAAVVNEIAGQNNPDYNCVTFGLDDQTGRVMATGPTGMVLIDGRRTPLAPGTTLADLGGDVQINVLPVLAPDRRYPFRRVIVNYLSTAGGCAHSTPATTVQRFAVFADRLPVTVDPGIASVDGNTFDGALPRGTDVNVSYGGNASGAGAHVMSVGSYGGVVDNTNGGQFVDGNQLPLGGGNRNLLAGYVQQTRGTDGSAVVDSTALGDGNGTTATGIAQCTSGTTFSGCAHQAVPSGGPSTGQQWPFPVAQCTQPGSKDTASSVRNGFSVTTGYDAKGKPQQSQVPGSDALAQSIAKCAEPKPVAGTAVANALLQSLSLGSTGAGVLGIDLGTSETSTVMSPPQNGVASATSTATARGVHISVSGYELTIDTVSQSATAKAGGRPGTASASREVTLAGVRVTSPAGGQSVICAGTCRTNIDQVLAQINAELPTTLEVVQPSPDTRFGAAPMDDNGHQDIKGSPGGYVAVVQSSLAQQDGDAQFNAVPASDGETTLLPALRVVAFYDAGPAAANQLDRQIVDLAPVQVDAEYGINLLDTSAGQQTPTVADQKVAAAVTPVAGKSWVPGTPGTGGAPQLAGGATSAGNVFERSLAGFDWLIRSPMQALRIFLTLLLLAVPVLVAVRRSLWIRSITGGRS